MQPTKEQPLPLIKVVGVSGSGKSTLVKSLRTAGYRARPVSQEHSSVPDLWRQFESPRILIYLHVDLEHQLRRRPDVSWSVEQLANEEQRLAHARQHADLRLDTSGLKPEAVLELALALLKYHRIKHADYPLPPVSTTGSARPST
jgi:ABC-type glutathione transport system ATPase component